MKTPALRSRASIDDVEPKCTDKCFDIRIGVAKLDAGAEKSAPESRAAPGEEGQIIADLSGDEAFEGCANTYS